MSILRNKSGRIRTGWIILILLIALVSITAWYYLFRVVPTHFGSPEDHFKYGSIGVEDNQGVPYWIWLTLPRLFPEYLPGPGGYASLGINWEEGKELPMGFPKKTIGFPRVGVNCATCHITRLRTSPQDVKPMFMLAGPSQQFDAQGYQRFLFNSASDPRFNAGYIMNALKNVYDFNWIERLLYRYVIIPQTRRALLKQKEDFAWQNIRPRQGNGRVDPFNPMKFIEFHLPEDHSIGNSDIPSIWNQRPRIGQSLHWDGLSKDFFEVAVSSGIGDGASRRSIDLDSLRRIQEWLNDFQPPKYPFPIDQALAAKGKEIYDRTCASCHAFGQSRTGTVVPVTEVGTDPHRVNAWTQAEVDAWKQFAQGYPFNFNTFSKTNGYVSDPLDGIWLRAPYLHNGSVPTLRDLLEPPEKRPNEFYRGYDVYDPVNVGFVSNVPSEGGRVFFKYDTSVPANGNGGHVYGTGLTADEKRALLEYLKTL
jgi:hypothetical protein